MYIIGKRYESFPYQEDLSLKDLSELEKELLNNHCNKNVLEFENNNRFVYLSSKDNQQRDC